ncbi:MAG: UDP-N-acetylmuramate--L-alanine ligase [Thermoanaerobaculia bacterium]
MMFRTFAGLSRVHFVGIGGAGMSGIAEVLLDYQLEVSGCDAAANEATDRLARLGVAIHFGHSAEHLEGVDLVVKSSAVPDDNVEIAAARKRGITVARRSEMLGELMRLKYGIAVAGTHGKTTTTSMVGAILTEAGLDPTVIVGGRLRVSGTGARLGKSDYLVAEADEFDRSFLRLAPVIAVITNIDADHLDTYGDLAAIKKAFVDFADRVPFFGRVILCLDNPNIQAVLPELAGRRLFTYGLTPQADLSAVVLETRTTGSRFLVKRQDGGELGELEVPMPGSHNIANALAATAVGLSLEVPFATIARALSGFGGVHRRFELVGSFQGASVIDDYAHHPTEVAATLEAARQSCPRGRVLAIFQPHLFSRTRDHAGAFGRALLSADRAWVTDIYASREKAIPGVSAELVVEAARASGHHNVELCPNWRELPSRLASVAEPGDLIITLGAGDIYQLGRALAASGEAA